MKIMCIATKRLGFLRIFCKLLKNKGTWKHSEIISGILPHRPMAWQIFPKKESHMTFVKKYCYFTVYNEEIITNTNKYALIHICPYLYSNSKSIAQVIMNIYMIY